MNVAVTGNGEFKKKTHWAERGKLLGFVVDDWGRMEKVVVEERGERGTIFWPLYRQVFRS